MHDLWYINKDKIPDEMRFYEIEYPFLIKSPDNINTDTYFCNSIKNNLYKSIARILFNGEVLEYFL